MARAVLQESGEAESLESRLEGGERFGQAQLVSLLRAIGDGLIGAHRAGRFHGTLTPADVTFDVSGEVEIDGWSRDTTPDAMRASPYAPIECYAPVHPQGPWTDVYSLGAIAWRVVTGAPPAEVLHRKGDTTLTRLAPPGFDPAFLRAVDAALEIAPQRRPQTVEQWLALLPAAVHAPHAPAVGEAPQASKVDAVEARAAVSAPAPASTQPPARRHAWPLAAAAAMAAVFGTLWRGAPPEPEREPPRPTPAALPQPAAEAPAPPMVEPANRDTAVTIEPTPPAVTVVAAPPKPEPARPAPAPRAPPKAESTKPPVPAPVAAAPPPAFEPDGGEAPRALLVRTDKRLRQLFGQYARMRARVERSYDDPDIPYEMKRWAFREGRHIQQELVELRDVRNRIANTGNFRSANRRFDEFEATAARLSARMDDVRRSF